MGLQVTHLDETDGSRLLTEALAAEVESVLADETSLVSAEAAGYDAMRFHFPSRSAREH